ncbi:hypothetical protein COOONC_08470 [Cooperia oncophora]
MLVLVGLLLPLVMAMPFDMVSNLATVITYDDNFARTKMLPLAAAAYSDTPQQCLSKFGKDVKMKSITSVTCDITLVDKCTGYSAVSTDDKAIILSFRGTNKNSQLIMESEETMQKNHVPYTFRVTHAHDIIPHLPLENMEGYYHHKTEAFYKKGMEVGAHYDVCYDMGESTFCSDGQLIDTSMDDHRRYFEIEVPHYGKNGCQ